MKNFNFKKIILAIYLLILILGNTDLAFISPIPHNVARADGIPTGESYILYEHWGGNWTDTEKTPQNTEDDLMDWAASASNVLYWTGWGLVEGMYTSDEMFQYILDHWTDSGGLQVYGWDWWFDGTNPSQGWPGWSQVDVSGGNFWPSYTFSSYYHEDWDDWDALSAIDTYLRSGYGVGIAVYTDSGGAHMLTVWGFNYNPSDPSDYYGLWISDSDDYKSWTNPPDKIRYYEVSYSSSDLRWYLQNYYASNNWYIGGVMALEPFPSNRPVADAGESYAGYVGLPVTFDASGSTDADGDPLQYRWNFDLDYDWDTEWSIVPTTTYTWSTGHIGSVAVQVTDGHMLDVDIATITVSEEIENEPPIAYFTMSTSITNVGSTVAFDPTQSSDPEGGNLLLTWILYDEQGTQVDYIVYEYLPGETLDVLYYEFDQPGTYTIELRVSDYELLSTTSDIITVNEIPPEETIIERIDVLEDSMVNWFMYLISDVINPQFTALTDKLLQLQETIQYENVVIMDLLYQLRDTIIEGGQATRDKVDLVRENLDNTLDVRVVTGEKESRYYSYYVHMREWSDGDYLDPADPELTIRVAINDEQIDETDYNIIRISQGLCKLLIDKSAIPIGINALIVDVEYNGVHGSDIISVENLAGMVNIGVIFPTMDTLNEQIMILEKARNDINNYCTKLGTETEFNFVVEQADSNAERHLEIIQDFHNQGINLVIGGFWSSQAASSLSYCIENDMILFSPSSTLASLAIPEDNLYRLTANDEEQSKAIAAILQERGVDSLVVIQIELDLIDSVFEAIRSSCDELGIQVYDSIKYPYEARDDLNFDFATYLTECDNLARDIEVNVGNVGFLCLTFDEVARMLLYVDNHQSKLRTLESVEWFGWEANAGSQIVEDYASEAASRFKLFSTRAAPSRSEKWNEFIDSMPGEPGFYEGCLYDIAWIYAKAVIEGGNTDTEVIKNMVYDITDQYYGVTGWCHLNQAGDRSPMDFDIMAFNSIDGWYVAARYDKYAEEIVQLNII